MDNNGNTAVTYTYDAYGTPTTSPNPTATTTLLWQGQYHDPATGLYNLRARWYDPANGQFLSVDPLNQLTQTPYSYGADNPISNSDPTGLHSIGMTALHGLEYGTGAITGGATTAIATALGGGCYEGSAPNWVNKVGMEAQIAMPFIAPELESVEILSSVADAVDGSEAIAKTVEAVDTADTAISTATEDASRFRGQISYGNPGANALGSTDKFGNITIRPGLPPDVEAETIAHEQVHAFFSPAEGTPFAEARANLGMWGYQSSHALRFTEEFIAEARGTGSLSRAFDLASNYYNVSGWRVGAEATGYLGIATGSTYLAYNEASS